MSRKIEILDTTLRDGAQSRGISFSVEDKCAIAATLDSIGIDFIELGNPSSAPREAEVFTRIRETSLSASRPCAFGSTRRKDGCAEEDLAALVATGMPVAVIFGKAWLYHVREVLVTTPEENLRMIADSVSYLRGQGMEVIFDAEHYFDGAREDSAYAHEVLQTALRAGAQTVVLCDTNGGVFPDEIAMRVAEAYALCGDRIGIHCHDDCGCAVASTLAAVLAGARHVQGTLLGFGERCGNANLSTVIPNLQLKLGFSCIPDDAMASLTFAARRVADVANISLYKNMPYVGSNAFAHKAGMHADGIYKNTRTFEHIDPSLVGNTRRIVTSELAGRNLILRKLQMIAPGLTKDSPETQALLDMLKTREQAGYTYEAADASFELMARRAIGRYQEHFELLFYKTIGEYPVPLANPAAAIVKVRVDGKEALEAGEGNGPVNALDDALRRALTQFYPRLDESYLSDFKVRVLNPEAATAAVTRVLMTSTDGRNTWSTIGVSGDILEACLLSLTDAIEYKLMLDDKENS
ncbi:MAG: citramalate synthase [Clostridiaceae bacterium]|nr:citramalate synthase [Clostridiaceae bacterium]